MRISPSLLHGKLALINAPSISASKNRVKLLASEILANAQSASTVEESSTPGQSSNALFNQLPDKLADFFRRYPPSPFQKYSDVATSIHAEDANPFLANKNPATNKYRAPIYSLRRQSDLYKIAYRYGISHLLPPLANGKKFYEHKYETKTPPKGSLTFKLSRPERNADKRNDEIQKAIENADETIVKSRGKKYLKRFEKRQAKEKLAWY